MGRRKSDLIRSFLRGRVFFATIRAKPFPARDRSRFLVDWSTPHYETKVGGAILVRDVKSPKKPYYAPSFEVIEIKTAKTKLEAEVT